MIGPTAETPDLSIDYDFAQAELMSAQMGDDPIQEAISAIEKQHVDDKAGVISWPRRSWDGLGDGLIVVVNIVMIFLCLYIYILFPPWRCLFKSSSLIFC